MRRKIWYVIHCTGQNAFSPRYCTFHNTDACTRSKIKLKHPVIYFPSFKSLKCKTKAKRADPPCSWNTVIFDNLQHSSEMLSEALQSAERNGASAVEWSGSTCEKKPLSVWETAPLLTRRIKTRTSAQSVPVWALWSSRKVVLETVAVRFWGQWYLRAPALDAEDKKMSVFWIISILEPLCKLWRGRKLSLIISWVQTVLVRSFSSPFGLLVARPPSFGR